MRVKPPSPLRRRSAASRILVINRTFLSKGYSHRPSARRQPTYRHPPQLETQKPHPNPTNPPIRVETPKNPQNTPPYSPRNATNTPHREAAGGQQEPSSRHGRRADTHPQPVHKPLRAGGEKTPGKSREGGRRTRPAGSLKAPSGDSQPLAPQPRRGSAQVPPQEPTEGLPGATEVCWPRGQVGSWRNPVKATQPAPQPAADRRLAGGLRRPSQPVEIGFQRPACHLPPTPHPTRPKGATSNVTPSNRPTLPTVRRAPRLPGTVTKPGTDTPHEPCGPLFAVPIGPNSEWTPEKWGANPGGCLLLGRGREMGCDAPSGAHCGRSSGVTRRGPHPAANTGRSCTSPPPPDTAGRVRALPLPRCQRVWPGGGRRRRNARQCDELLQTVHGEHHAPTETARRNLSGFDDPLQVPPRQT